MRIAIIGGGASGVLTALEVLRAGTAGDAVVVYEPGVLGAGVAYAVPDDTVQLNVRASNMSVYADQPGHFVAWLTATERSTDPDAFVPRRWYAAYLADSLAAAIATSGVSFQHVAEPVQDVVWAGGAATVITATGPRAGYDRVVLATGHQHPSNPLERWVPRSERMLSGYDWQRIAAIPAAAAVLIIGTGLTMVDAVATLRAAGHQGPITITSRRGLLPRRHVPRASVAAPLTAADAQRPLSEQLRIVRAATATAAAAGVPWQAVIDSLRPHTQALWQGYSPALQQRFLRHLRAYWDVHRHRIAPEVGALLDDASSAGQIRVVTGRTRSAQLIPNGYRVEITTAAGVATVEAAWVIGCTGPDTDLEQSTAPFYQMLRDHGYLRADALRLGVDTTVTGRLIGRNGSALPWFFAVGPLRKGLLWECIAIPDIRTETAQLAGQLLTRGGA